MWRELGHLKSRLREFKRNERGAVFIIVALAMPVIFGAAAVSVDMGQLLYVQAELRAAADAAALAAATSLDDEDNAKTLATTYAQANMPVSHHGEVLNTDDVVLGNWDDDGREFTAAGSPTNAVRVTVRRATANQNPVSLYFASVVGLSDQDVETEAIAYAESSGGGGTFCLWATEESEASAFLLNGTTSLDLGDCGIAVSSTDSDKALEAPGTVDIDAGSICVAGGSLQGGSGTIDPSPTENCNDIPDDPLADLATPTVEDCDFNDYNFSDSDTTETVTPGTYCGGLEISGSNNTITFEPGVYVLDSGGFKMSGSDNTLETGSGGIGGVVFYNTSTEDSYGDIDFSGSGTTGSLTAPTSGTYAGVLFHQDPSQESADSGIKFKLAGEIDVLLDGVIYVPDHQVEYSGTTDHSMRCTKIIGRTITYSGTTGSVDPDSCAADNVAIGDSGETTLRLAR